MQRKGVLPRKFNALNTYRVIDPPSAVHQIAPALKEIFASTPSPSAAMVILFGDPAYEWENQRKWDLLLAALPYPAYIYILPNEKEDAPFLLPHVKKNMRTFAEQLNAAAILKLLDIEAEKVEAVIRHIAVESTESYTLQSYLNDFLHEIRSPFLRETQERLKKVRFSLNVEPERLDLEKERLSLTKALVQQLKEIGDLIKEALDVLKREERQDDRTEKLFEEWALFACLLYTEEEEKRQKAFFTLLKQWSFFVLFVGDPGEKEVAKAISFYETPASWTG